MTDTSRNVIVGLTALIGLAALAFLALMFGTLEKYTTDTYVINIQLNTATGLSTGSRVKLSGIDIGYVESLHFTDDSATAVDLVCRIDTSRKIPANSSVTAAGSLLGGASQLAIVPQPRKPGAGAITFVPTDGSGRLAGTVSSMSDKFTQVADNLRDQLKPAVEHFAEVSKKIGTMADEYTALGKKLNAALEPRSLADVDSGKAQPNFASAIARADQRLAELKQTLASINSVLSDKQLMSDVRATASNARQLTADAKDKINQLATRYVGLADDMSHSLNELNGLLADARNGKGTMGKLIQDPALYNNLTDAAARLTEAIKSAQLLLEKWKAEGLPIQF